MIIFPEQMLMACGENFPSSTNINIIKHSIGH